MIISTKNSVVKIGQSLQSANLSGLQNELKNQNVPDNLDKGETEGVALQNSVKEDNQMIGWKAYNNIDYIYQIKHPDGWFIDSSKPEQVYISPNPPKDGVFSESAIKISVKPTDQSDSADKQMENIIKTLNTDVFSIERIKIDGEDGFKIKLVCLEDNCGLTEWLAIKNNNFYLISSNLESGPIVDQIISTFRFVQ